MILTHSVWQNLQSYHPLVTIQLQAVDAVEAIVFNQVERRVDRNLVQHCALPLRWLTYADIQEQTRHSESGQTWKSPQLHIPKFETGSCHLLLFINKYIFLSSHKLLNFHFCWAASYIWGQICTKWKRVEESHPLHDFACYRLYDRSIWKLWETRVCLARLHTDIKKVLK